MASNCDFKLNFYMVLLPVFIFTNNSYAADIPLTINGVQSNGVNININCPDGYTEGKHLMNSAGGGYDIILPCERNDISDYNLIVNKIVQYDNDWKTTNNNLLTTCSATKLLSECWADKLGERSASYYNTIVPADIRKIRSMGVDRIDPVSNSDAAVVKMAGRLGVRKGIYISPGTDGVYDTLDDQLVSGGYREFRYNQIHGTCETGFSEGSFLAQTDASWNARPGDAILTKNTNHPLADLFSATHIEFTHTGMATGPYGVRHMTGYEDAMIDNIDSSDLAKVHIDAQYLYSTGPGAITENLDGTFCKADPGSTDICPAGKTQSRREFMDGSTYILTTSNADTRVKLRNALTWAKNTDLYYTVYAFSNGIYGGGHNACSTFVRDALISSYTPDGFDANITAPPNLFYVETLLGPGSIGSWDLLNTYKPVWKSFYYSPETREAGGNWLYKSIFEKAVAVSTPQANATFESNIFAKIYKTLFPGIVGETIKHIAQNIATQIVNCFAFNECSNYSSAPAYVEDSAKSMSWNGQKPNWPVSSFKTGRPPEEGYAFSADDVLYFSAYDRFEKLVKSESQIINSCQTGASCSEGTYFNQRDYRDAAIKSCAASEPICECTSSIACQCANESRPWLKEKVSVVQKTPGYSIEFDNDRTDGNPKSIYKDRHGPYVWNYTPNIKQTLTFSAYHDIKEYYSLAPDIKLSKPFMVEAINDFSGDPVPKVTFPVEAGEQVTIGMSLYYFFDTQVTWIILTKSHMGIISYWVPRGAGYDPVVSLTRAVELKFNVWEYQ